MFFSLSKRPKGATQYSIAITSVIVVALLGYIIRDIAGYRVAALLLLVTVSLLAIFLDIKPVLLSAFISALIWDFFFIPPRFTFYVGNTEDALMLLLYFLIALVNAVLTNRIRKAEKELVLKEEKEKTIRLYNTILNSLSHELRTPIATIIGATDNLQNNNSNLSDYSRTELVEEISKASLRLNQQVENLLNMSRLESGFIRPNKDWCDIGELVYAVAKKLGESLNNHVLKISVEDNMPLFRIDFELIDQALYNILLNAVQYTPGGSIILIDAHSKEYLARDEAGIDIVAAKLVIVIADNGPGIAEGNLQKIFDKFYRLQGSNVKGTGLGLSIVKGFVEAHNGTVSARNWESGGAEFTIEIPAETTYINSLKNE